eukprot:206071-Pleurochrysis_carterae.AAC.3
MHMTDASEPAHALAACREHELTAGCVREGQSDEPQVGACAAPELMRRHARRAQVRVRMRLHFLYVLVYAGKGRQVREPEAQKLVR